MFGTAMRRALVAAVAVGVLGGSLGACGGGDGDGDTGGTKPTASGGGRDASSGDVEAGIVKGRVTDSAGNPIKGAEIVVDNQFLYDSNIVLTTDAQGKYRAEMPGAAATYNVTASFKKTYNNAKYTFRLAPENPELFAGRDGAVRDFTWKLTGEQPDAPDTFYGGTVLFDLSPINPADDSYVDSAGVTLTLTPTGPLVDGTPGKPVTKRAENTGDGWAVRDIPVGPYKITATLTTGSGRKQPLAIRTRDEAGPYTADVTANFKPYLTDHQRIELELALRG